MTISGGKLFQPVKVGRLTLQHRVAMAPMTRFRATKAHVPILPTVADFYKQRGSTPGTLLVTEGVFIAPQAGGYDNVPGTWSNEQIAAWKQVTDAVHAQGSFIYIQLWALGRTAKQSTLAAENLPYVSASDVPLSYQADPLPRPLTTTEIKEYVQLYATAASNAVHKAGFDGIEIHGANGYLVDQFLQDKSNTRTDEYGGSIEGRTRFALEVLEAVSKEIGPDRTAIRLSPWSLFQEMRMDDPKPTFSYLVSQIRERLPELAYIHVIEPRVALGFDERPDSTIPAEEENDFIRKLWAPKAFLSAGGYTRELAIKAAERGDIVAVGRHFISNPDLPRRWKDDLPLTAYNRDAFYAVDPSGADKGYTDYPFAEHT
ncbi:hypothetical protein ONZ45_g17964 [Pleurotus djamor]|nr:hypothetical protein ONZ45_g17964 [Pleurotus djamor]